MEKTVQQGVMRQRDDAKKVSMGSNIVTFKLTGEETGGLLTKPYLLSPCLSLEDFTS